MIKNMAISFLSTALLLNMKGDWAISGAQRAIWAVVMFIMLNVLVYTLEMAVKEIRHELNKRIHDGDR